jgi:uncharacterized protein YebE (UPF0316 family)
MWLIDTIVLAGLAMFSVSLWTARVALTAQRRRLAATAMAAVEATVFAVAFSRLLTGLDNPLGLVAYGAGVAAGTAAALVLDDVLNPQLVKVDIVDPSGSDRLVDQLRCDGWPTTVAAGHGLSGLVTVISVTTDQSRLAELMAAVDRHGPDVFLTVTAAQKARPTPVPVGFTQPAATRRSQV